jgi:DNA-binding XRE family transcriptional regulator
MTTHEICDAIVRCRTKTGLTQEQFARRYNVSGPAIFKFEKGYLKPSLDLWLMMAKDIGLPEESAVLMWVRERLPEKYKRLIDPNAVSGPKASPIRGSTRLLSGLTEGKPVTLEKVWICRDRDGTTYVVPAEVASQPSQLSKFLKQRRKLMRSMMKAYDTDNHIPLEKIIEDIREKRGE